MHEDRLVVRVTAEHFDLRANLHGPLVIAIYLFPLFQDLLLLRDVVRLREPVLGHEVGVGLLPDFLVQRLLEFHVGLGPAVFFGLVQGGVLDLQLVGQQWLLGEGPQDQAQVLLDRFGLVVEFRTQFEQQFE